LFFHSPIETITKAELRMPQKRSLAAAKLTSPLTALLLACMKSYCLLMYRVESI